MARRRKGPANTPLRSAIDRTSPLRDRVCDGIGAVKRPDHSIFAPEIRETFGDSLDLDAALQERHPQENRWDYLLGHTPSNKIVAVEPHAAREDQVNTVIKKKQAAKQQLSAHLKPGQRVLSWLWVSSGKVHFADTEKARRLLDQNGVHFVGRRVLAKHLPPKP